MLHNPYSHHYFNVPHALLHVPYTGDIPHGVVPGKQIFISGHVPHHASKFEINLKGPQGYALHINPRFEQGSVVRNTAVHGGWGGEEKHGGMPFHRGQDFEVIISVEHDKYRVAVNGHHQFDYHHRAPFNNLHEITHLTVEGHVELRAIVFSGGASAGPREVHAPHVPFAIPLHGTQPGKMIQIHGHLPHDCNRFVINLQNGHDHNCNGHDIPLHISARFDDPYAGQVVVRTNKMGGWGEEQRDGGFPFHRGANFTMLLLCEPHEWKIAVNGVHFASFPHRNNFHNVNHLYVEGNVHITSVREFN